MEALLGSERHTSNATAASRGGYSSWHVGCSRIEATYTRGEQLSTSIGRVRYRSSRPDASTYRLPCRHPPSLPPFSQCIFQDPRCSRACGGTASRTARRIGGGGPRPPRRERPAAEGRAEREGQRARSKKRGRPSLCTINQETPGPAAHKLVRACMQSPVTR